ncbi:MAG: SET domain-containing methyltransferase [Candidatus Woesearchaeota archaeon]
MFASDKTGMKETEKGKSVFAKKEIEEGEKILEFERNFVKRQTRTSMQVDEGPHQESTDPDAAENFLNHSCEPNAYIDFDDYGGLSLRALRQINKGEEITFNFLTTEWELAEPFDCRCGSPRCYGRIKGFRYLSREQKEKLRPLLSPYLKRRMKVLKDPAGSG